MRKAQEITQAASKGYYFTGETETAIQIIAVDMPISEEDCHQIGNMLGLVYESHAPIETETVSDKSFIAIVFRKTPKFDLLKEFF